MLGERLRLLRGKRTQQEIADKLGISRARYSHYENNHVQPDNELLQKMADLHQVSVDYLLGRTDDPKKELSAQARLLVDSLELSDEEIIKKINFLTVDGIPLTEEQIRAFLAYVRVERAKQKQKDKG